MKAIKKEIYWQCDLMAIIDEILVNMTQVSDVAPGPLVLYIGQRNSHLCCFERYINEPLASTYHIHLETLRYRISSPWSTVVKPSAM
jgi:hypothetical protein